MTEKETPQASINVLDPRVAQQVAAGEVVDRPASVVKELVENALDAGASSVEVELGDGGTSRILVSDDGSGMSPENAKLSVLRHATSKIRNVEDIEAVMTLGFRGEALPSIASVSSFSLTTSTGEGAATKVAVEGGAEAEVSAASHPKGTTVLVDRLFYNVPARRAFLKGRAGGAGGDSGGRDAPGDSPPEGRFPSDGGGQGLPLATWGWGSPGASGPDPGRRQGARDAQGRVRVGAFRRLWLRRASKPDRGEQGPPDDLCERPLRQGREPPPRPRRRLQGDRALRALPAGGRRDHRRPPPRRRERPSHKAGRPLLGGEGGPRGRGRRRPRRHRVASPGPALDPARPREDLHPGPLLRRTRVQRADYSSQAAEDPFPYDAPPARGLRRRANASRRPPGH